MILTTILLVLSMLVAVGLVTILIVYVWLLYAASRLFEKVAEDLIIRRCYYEKRVK